MSTISVVDRHAVLDMGSKYSPGFAWLCLFGSRIKQTATPASDFDVLVVFQDAGAPCKKCVFVEAGQRVDVISADLASLRDMVEHGPRSNNLSLARCIAESVCLPQENDASLALRALAAAALAAGSRLHHPQSVRIMLTRTLAQLRKVGSSASAVVIGMELLCMLREVTLIKLGIGKTDACYGDQMLQQSAPRFRQSMLAAATALCARRDAQPLLQLAQHVLDKLGGSLASAYETSLSVP
jgi:predicted nucleotidyltransferase